MRILLIIKTGLLMAGIKAKSFMTIHKFVGELFNKSPYAL